MKRMNTDI